MDPSIVETTRHRCSWCSGSGQVCRTHGMPGHNCFNDEVTCDRCGGGGEVDFEAEWVALVRGTLFHQSATWDPQWTPMDLGSRPAFLEACAVLHERGLHDLADELLNLAAMAWHRVTDQHRLRLARAMLGTLRDETSRLVS